VTDFPVFAKGELDTPQRALWDKITLGPRGFYCGGPDAARVPDLYNAWLQFPEFGDLMLQLGDTLRAKSDLTGKLRELVVLTTSALLGARVEYDFHVPFAKGHGLTDAVIEAIGAGVAPEFSDEAERAIYEANIQLVRTAALTEEARAAVIRAIGYPGLMQLIAAVSLYVITAYTSNVAKVKLADDFSADAKKLERFYAGHAAG
jgi:4-carboxymuconolactone decarboxylase